MLFFHKGPDLEKALDESDKLFQGAGARPTARKVLVVIMDKKSGVAESSVNDTANRLYEHYIDVIPVAIGEEADSKQLKLTTKDQSNMIEAPKVFVPDKLGETIMRKVLKGISPCTCLVGFKKENWSLSYVIEKPRFSINQ